LLGRVALPLRYRHPPLVGAGLTPQADRYPETPSGGTRTTVLALDRVWWIKASERARTAGICALGVDQRSLRAVTPILSPAPRGSPNTRSVSPGGDASSGGAELPVLWC
jgi:hypothetical protein